MQDASGAASENNLLFSADISGNDEADPEESVSLHDSSLHSRETKNIHSKDQGNDQKKKNDNNKMNQVPWTLMTITRQMMIRTNQMKNLKINPEEVEAIITTP